MNDDPKWDELENYLRGEALLWYRSGVIKEDDTEYVWPNSAHGKSVDNKDMILNLGPQVEADEWPEIVE